MHAAAARGEIKPSVVKDFDKATKGKFKNLPEKVEKQASVLSELMYKAAAEKKKTHSMAGLGATIGALGGAGLGMYLGGRAGGEVTRNVANAGIESRQALIDHMRPADKLMWRLQSAAGQTSPGEGYGDAMAELQAMRASVPAAGNVGQLAGGGLAALPGAGIGALVGARIGKHFGRGKKHAEFVDRLTKAAAKKHEA